MKLMRSLEMVERVMDKAGERDLEEIILPINNTMLIAVPVNKPDLLAELSDTFGRSKYFVVHNSTDNASEFLLNPFSTELGGSNPPDFFSKKY
jgi:hypothetical protein